MIEQNFLSNLVKGQYNFWNRMIFDLVPLEQLNSNWKKQLWFRNLQEKLANDTFESFIASITDLRAKEQNLPSPN